MFLNVHSSTIATALTTLCACRSSTQLNMNNTQHEVCTTSITTRQINVPLFPPFHGVKVAIDTLTYKFEVMREDPAEVTEGPDDGIYCHGLWLEGETPHVLPHTAMKLQYSKAG